MTAHDVDLEWSQLRFQCLDQPDDSQLGDVENWVRNCAGFKRSELPFRTLISGIRVEVTEQ